MVVVRRAALEIRREEDMVRVRRSVRQWADELGFGLVDQTKLVTAASELSRNALVHGGGGTVVFEALEDGPRRGLRLTFTDEGPGIPDVELALSDGYTTGSGLGFGLGGAKRLVNEVSIESRRGAGTRVVMTRWK